ncbi:hypothetical protein BJH93_02955 [Kocuria polaris]|nr:hypothetical protein [Kocuria polaris]
MRSSGLALAIAIAAIYAAFAGFFLTQAADEATLPAADRVVVTGETTTTGGDGLPHLLQGAAESSDAIIFREIRDLQSASVRHFYVAVGDAGLPQAQWLSSGYPSFSPALDTELHSVAGLEGTDPRGRYFVFGPEAASAGLAATFAELGYDTHLEHGSVSAGQAVVWIVGGPFGTSTLVALLLVTLLAGFAVVTNVKSYAVQCLHGTRKRTAVLRDFRRAAPAGAVTLATILACATTALWFYNDLHQFGAFLRSTATTFVVALVLILGIHAAVLVVLWNTRLLDGIKGRLGFHVAIPAAYLIRVPALVLAVSVIASAFATAGAALDADQAREDMKAAGTAATIRFEADASAEEMDRLAYASGAWLQQEDAAGRAILAVRVSPDDSATGTRTSADILLVNSNYLQANPVIDGDGRRLPGTPSETVRVLTPTDSTATPDDVVALVGDSLGETLPAVEVRQILADQSHFLYEPEPDSQQRPAWAKDAVLVVVDPESGVIRDDDYMAYASQGRVLMTDSAEAVRNTPQELLGPWISAYIPVAQAAADEYATRVTDLRIKSASAIVALGVLLATAVGLAQMHVRGNAQSILVRHVHGWGFLSTHRRLLAAEAILLAAVCGWALWRGVAIDAARTSDADPGIARGLDLDVVLWYPWAVAIVAILNLGLLIALVIRRTRSMISTHSEETA